MKNNLFVDKEWEFLLIDNICKTIRQKFTTKNVGILQLSYEYSGLMAQLVAHKLSTKNEPLDIEPINIPYTNEFDVVIHPNHLDPYENLIVLDSGCLS